MSLKDLPSPNATNFQNRVREEIHRLMGKFGANERALTLRDALDTGLLVPGPGGGLAPGGAEYAPDLTPPPQPDGFAVDAAISHIFIEHAAPTYTQGHGHMRTVVYGAQVSPDLPNPVFNDAVEIAQFSGTVFAYPTNPATTWRLWIKWQSNDGVLSATPAGGTNGLGATTGQDVASLLEALSGQIRTSELSASLSTRINLIDGLSSLPGSVNQRLGAEQAARVAAIEAERQARVTALLAEAQARGNAISNETQSRISADSSLQSQINMLSAAGSGDFSELLAAVQEEQTARIEGDLAEAAQRTTLAAQVVGISDALEFDNQYGDILQKGVDVLGRAERIRATAALSVEQLARTTSDEAFAQQITVLNASVGANTAALTVEQTTRATADSALSSSLQALSATVGVNTAAITTEQAARANADAALTTSVNYLQAQADSSLAAITTEQTARAAADAALASQINTVQSTVTANNNTLTAAISTEATTRATQTGELYAQYVIKADVGGLISGYGLASTANNAAPTSAFGIQAGQFFVAPPTVNQATAPVDNLYKGFVWRNSTTGLVQYWTGSAWSTTPQTLPFVVQAVPTTINGETVEPGVYMENVFMKRLVATRGQIGLLAVDDARIANLSAAKLTAGSIAVGQHIQSTGLHTDGSPTWLINGDGTAIFNNAVVRGTVFASAGLIGGNTIDSTGMESPSYSAGSDGWRLSSNGSVEFQNATVRGVIRSTDGKFIINTIDKFIQITL